MSTVHQAVLVEEAMLLLDVKPNGRYVDATLGGGGHTGHLLERSAPYGSVLSLDVDRGAILMARESFAKYGERWKGIEENFRELDRVVKEEKFSPVDGILFDLGISSDELADVSKGLSFRENGPLDMRLGPKTNQDGLTAADIVNTWSVEDIEKLIRNFGEERYAHAIARGIGEARKSSRIIGTLDFAAVVKRSVPRVYERGRIHPATRTFQALRIIVNDELESLRAGLVAAINVLCPGGRLAVISFHSLEDRLVKRFFVESREVERLTKKPICPTPLEREQNPRARSAKLRAIMKL